jgi:carboxypeptidase C (cathepsin A)
MQSKVPGLALSLVDGGHMLPLGAPELTARWIAEFVNSRASLSSPV